MGSACDVVIEQHQINLYKASYATPIIFHIFFFDLGICMLLLAGVGRIRARGLEKMRIMFWFLQR